MSSHLPRIAILFDHFGPYHRARLEAVSQHTDLLAVEFGRASSEYPWEHGQPLQCGKVTVYSEGESHAISLKEFQKKLFIHLDAFRPEVIFVPGWGSSHALTALLWALDRSVPAVLMSDSTAWDEPRKIHKESIKRFIVSHFAAALVAGSPHREYLTALGFPRDRIFLGYDVIDNEFFSRGVAKSREKGEVAKPNFLASARFVQKKNLPFLIRAYAQYLELLKGVDAPSRCDLVLLGDGPMRSELCRLVSSLGIEEFVQMPGFKTYEELPAYYASARAFIHASSTEQWGLVVNEAMASGLAVLVSNRCGCAYDLVREGDNGWVFDPFNSEQLAALMLRASCDHELMHRMGMRSGEIIQNWGLNRFVHGILESTNAAFISPIKDSGLFDRGVLACIAVLLR